MKKIYLKYTVGTDPFSFKIYGFCYWLMSRNPYNANESYFIIDSVFGFDKFWYLQGVNKVVRKYYICG